LPDWNRVRYEAFTRLGYFVTESSEHFSEYVPWFIKRDRPDRIERFRIPLDEYIRRCEGEIGMWEVLYDRIADPNVSIEDVSPEMLAAVHKMLEISVMPPELVEEIFELKRTGEYAPRMIHSMETGIASVTYGDVPNHGLIDNLPDGCIKGASAVSGRVRPRPRCSVLTNLRPTLLPNRSRGASNGFGHPRNQLLPNRVSPVAILIEGRFSHSQTKDHGGQRGLQAATATSRLRRSRAAGNAQVVPRARHQAMASDLRAP
jgi:hypothetical protein